MEHINLPPFYIGQRVVAIETGELWKKGDEFIVKGIKPGCCKTTSWKVDVGILLPPCGRPYKISCEYCHVGYISYAGNIFWAEHNAFAPIQESFQSISLEKVLEQETKLIGVN